MKNHLLTILTAFALIALGNLQAQSSPNNQGLVAASTFEGKTVTDPQGNELGHIERVLLDPQSGRARYAVVEVDKAWNWNDPQVAVPFQALNIDRRSDEDISVTLDATKERLQNAPKFKDGDADRIYSRSESEPVYSYWAITWFDDRPQTSGTGAQQGGNQQQGRNQGASGTNTSPAGGSSSNQGQ